MCPRQVAEKVIIQLPSIFGTIKCLSQGMRILKLFGTFGKISRILFLTPLLVVTFVNQTAAIPLPEFWASFLFACYSASVTVWHTQYAFLLNVCKGDAGGGTFGRLSTVGVERNVFRTSDEIEEGKRSDLSRTAVATL